MKNIVFADQLQNTQGAGAAFAHGIYDGLTQAGWYSFGAFVVAVVVTTLVIVVRRRIA